MVSKEEKDSIISISISPFPSDDIIPQIIQKAKQFRLKIELDFELKKWNVTTYCSKSEDFLKQIRALNLDFANVGEHFVPNYVDENYMKICDILKDITMIPTKTNNQLDDDEKKVILLLGVTGSGKSTLVSSVKNYVDELDFDEYESMGEVKIPIPTVISYTDPEDFSQKRFLEAANCSDGNTQLEASSQDPRSYVVSDKEDEDWYHEQIILIDTPGLGDSGKTVQDKINLNKIMDEIARYKEINTICLVMTSSTAVNFKPVESYTMSVIKDLIGSVFDSNLSVCYTTSQTTNFCPGANLRELKKIFPEIRDRVVCLDNEAYKYLVCKFSRQLSDEQKEANLSDDNDRYRKLWIKSSEATQQLFHQMRSMKRVSTKEIVFAFHLSQNIELLSEFVKPETELPDPVKTVIRDAIKKFQQCKEDIKTNLIDHDTAVDTLNTINNKLKTEMETMLG